MAIPQAIAAEVAEAGLEAERKDAFSRGKVEAGHALGRGVSAERKAARRVRGHEGTLEDVIAEGCRLYIITPETFDLHAFADSLAGALDAGDVAAVQLRLKNAPDEAWKRAIDALRPVCQSRRVELLLNDRADLVAAAGCDGAHVGQEDMPARRRVA